MGEKKNREPRGGGGGARGVGGDSAGERRSGRGEGGDNTSFLLVEVLCFALRGEGEKSGCAKVRCFLKRLPSHIFSLGHVVNAAPCFPADSWRQSVIR